MYRIYTIHYIYGNAAAERVYPQRNTCTTWLFLIRHGLTNVSLNFVSLPRRCATLFYRVAVLLV